MSKPGSCSESGRRCLTRERAFTSRALPLDHTTPRLGDDRLRRQARLRVAFGTWLAARPRVLLEFDRGTVLLSGFSTPEVANLPGVLWDPRVRAYRAPGHRYGDIRNELKRSGLSFHDQVRGVDDPPPGHWRAVDLRPYQAAALSSWELSGARGLIILPTGAGKTLLAVAAMAWRGRRALCLVPTRVLLEQWRSALEGYYAGPIGQYGDGKRVRETI